MVEPPHPDASGRWSPPASLGAHLRVQAAEGYRAAVIELKPGLYIVAEVPEHVTRAEFGVLPLLAPLVIQAAARELAKPPEERVLPRLLEHLHPPEAEPDDEDDWATPVIGRWVSRTALAGLLRGGGR